MASNRDINRVPSFG